METDDLETQLNEREIAELAGALAIAERQFAEGAYKTLEEAKAIAEASWRDKEPDFGGVLTTTIIRQLYELANTPFTLRDFRKQWESYGWMYEPGFGDEFGFRVSIPDDWFLIVDPLKDRVINASLPICYWEGFEPSSHNNLKDYQRQRAAYDQVYHSAKELAWLVLPPVLQEWTDEDENEYKAVIWKGEYGLLILQQACYDPQFGVEVNFWLAAYSKGEIHPYTLFIDWLCQRSLNLHDKEGF